MTAQQDPYVRVYYRVIDDPKFADVFDDDARLACWLRLLLIADGTYPAPAPIPAGVKRAAFAHLVKVGLVDLEPGSRFRIHGMDAERGLRSRKASDAARTRWSDAKPDAVAMRPHSVSNASASDTNMHSAPLLSEPLHSTPRRSAAEHPPASTGELRRDVPEEAHRLRELAEELTQIPNVMANVWGGLGEKAVRLAMKHGIASVEREWRRIAAEERGMPELRQLVLGADNALNRLTASKPMTEAERKEAEIQAAIAQIKAETAGAPA